MAETADSPPPLRTVHQGDGVLWAAERAWAPHETIVTSLPDVSETQFSFDDWRAWFIETSRLLCERVHPDSLVVFYQTDIKHEGAWIDKGYLVSRGAELAQAHTVFHKIVCRAPAGVVTFGRPAYAHLLAFSRHLRLTKGQSSADVLPKMGEMTWPRAMGLDACHAVARFLAAHTQTKTVVDPFCGIGTMLAVANDFGFDALGAELSKKHAERARTLKLSSPPR
jgi:hypothetical protein